MQPALWQPVSPRPAPEGDFVDLQHLVTFQTPYKRNLVNASASVKMDQWSREADGEKEEGAITGNMGTEDAVAAAWGYLGCGDGCAAQPLKAG